MALRKFDLLLCRPASREMTMVCRFGFIVTILAALLSAPAANAQAGPDPSGIWLTQAGDAKIRVRKCGGRNFGGGVLVEEPNHPANRKPHIHDKKSNSNFAQRPTNSAW